MIEFFLWLRWLRLPFLEEKAAELIRQLVVKHPAEALLAWSILPREHDADDEARRERMRCWMQLRIQGGHWTPAALPEGESWRQAVRLLLLETDFPVAEVERMYSQVHVNTLHHPTAQALLPWGNALLGISGRWPASACHGTTYTQQQNADGRRSQWRHAFRHLDPNQVIRPKTREKALNEMKQQAVTALATSPVELEQMLREACASPPHASAIRAALHLEPFRRLVATVLLDQGASS